MAMVSIYLNVMFVRSRIPNLCQRSRQVTLQHIYTIQAKKNERTENEAKYFRSQKLDAHQNWMFFAKELFIYLSMFFRSSVAIV